jgi:hypothetical protein
MLLNCLALPGPAAARVTAAVPGGLPSTRMVVHWHSVAVGTFFTPGPKIFKLAAPYIIISGNIGNMILVYLSSSAALCICISPNRSRMFCNMLCFF